MPPVDLRTAANPRGVAIAPPKAPAAPAAALGAFHHEEAQSHVPSVAAHNEAMGQRAAAALPAKYVATTPVARATQAFHTEEAQSHNPAVQRANELRGQLAAVGMADKQAEQRHQLALQLIQQHALQERANALGASGPQIAEATIHANTPEVQKLMKAAPGVLGNLGTDFVTLPKSTVQGLWYMGKAAEQSVAHGSPEPLLHLGGQILNTDPLALTLQGRFSEALHQAAAHPLLAATDVGGVTGIAGRVAGVGGRLAGVADHLMPAARAPIELPGGLPPIERRYSPNILKAVIQKHMDERPPGFIERNAPSTVKLFGKRVPIGQFDREMYKRANEHQLVVSSLQQHAEQWAREHPHPTLPMETHVARSRATAKRAATLDAWHSNALRNRRTGGIFFTSKRKPNPVALQRLGDQGYQFEMVRVPRAISRGQTKWVAMPKTFNETMAAHEALHSGPHTLSGSIYRAGLQRFRRTVLPFSTKWILGNTAEAGLRSALVGVAPWHEPLARDLLETMAQQGHVIEAQRLTAHALQGTHFSMMERHAAEYATEHPHSFVRGFGKVAHAAGKPADISFKGNSAIEQTFSRGVLGKYVSADMKLLRKQHPDWDSERIMQELATMYAKPEKAAAVGRFARRTLGQYAAFGPSASSFVHNVAPFAPWYGNAVKFMGTLPFRHPAFTAANLATARATDKEWAKEHKAIEGLGGDVQGFPIAKAPYQALDIGRYIPQGAFSAGTGLKPWDAALADIAPVVAPNVSDAFKAALGLDPFGRPLSYPGIDPAHPLTKTGRKSQATVHYAPTGEARGANAISSLLGGMLGWYPQGRRILGERGATPYTGTDLIWNPNPPTKQTKPPFDLAGILAGLNKVLNPVKPIDLKPRKKPKSKATRPSSWGTGGFPSGGFGSGGFPSG